MSDSAALDAVLKSSTSEEAVRMLRQYDVQPYERIRSIFDSVVTAKNLSLEAKAESLEYIANADMILGKINRNQSWRLLRYFDRYLALAIAGKNVQRTDSSVPWNLRLAIWNDGRVLKGVNAALAEFFHTGKSDVSSLYLPYLAIYFKKNPKALDQFLAMHEFGDSEKRVLLKLASLKK
jgi:hypothetical protein